MDNSCEKYIPMISAHIDGELSPFDESRLSQHLEQCPYCRDVLAGYQAIHSSRFLSEPPPGLHEDIMARIKAQPKPRRKKIIPFRYATVAAAVIAVALLGASGVFGNLFSSLTPKEASVQSAAAAMDTAVAEAAAEIREIPAEIVTYDIADDAEAAPVMVEMPEPVKETTVEEAAPVIEEDEETIMTFTAVVATMENGSYGCVISYEGEEGDTAYLPQELFIEQELLGSEPLTLGDRVTVTVAVGGTDEDPTVEVIDVIVDHEE